MGRPLRSAKLIDLGLLKILLIGIFLFVGTFFLVVIVLSVILEDDSMSWDWDGDMKPEMPPFVPFFFLGYVFVLEAVLVLLGLSGFGVAGRFFFRLSTVDHSPFVATTR